MQRLEKIGEKLWLAEGGIVDFYSFPYPTRMLIAEIGGGDLWVWSPVKLSPLLQRDVDAIGRVAHLVSPNKIHHLYLGDWHRHYPEATLWGPETTIRRHDELSFGPPLEDKAPTAWGPDFDQAWFRGSPFMDEIAFFHRPSKTAIFADLIEAFSEEFMREHWGGWKTALARVDGITEKKPRAPLEWRMSFIDRAPARAARDKVLSWHAERVIMAHGTWCRENGQAFLARTFAWLGPEGHA